MTALRPAVNLTWLAPGRVGGSEEYLVRQLAGLPADGTIEPTLYCQPSFAAAHPALAERYATVVMPLRRDSRALRIAAEHTWLAARTRRADLVHHGGGTAPRVGRRPIVLTIHDLQYREHPEYFGRARLAYLARTMPGSARRAAVIAVPTGFVRDTVVDAFRVPPERVVVVPHGVPVPAAPSDEAIADARRRVGVGDRPYLVYPAITHPHKGHRLAVELLAHAPPELALVLTGGAGAAEADVFDAIRATRLESRVVRTGRVPADVRDALVAGAEAMVFPSEYEGFGAPLVEAMVLGTPVVCGVHAAVREVVGPAGIVVAGRDPAAWAAAVADALGRREHLVAAGRERAREFGVERSGQALAAAYRQAVGA